MAVHVRNRPAVSENEAIEVIKTGSKETVVTRERDSDDEVTMEDERGSIEIEGVERSSGSVVISRITFNPSDHSKELPLILERPRSSSGMDTFEEVKEEEPSTMEKLFDTFMNPCASTCYTPMPCQPMKSALRRKGDICGSAKHVNDDACSHVSFSSLNIREYKLTLGDHPSARSGPPMSLDWDYNNARVVDLDTYEKSRHPRRHRRKLKLTFQEREKILLEERGFSKDEVREAWAAAIEIRKQRKETNQRAKVNERMDEAWESASRKFWRLMQYETE